MCLTVCWLSIVSVWLCVLILTPIPTQRLPHRSTRSRPQLTGAWSVGRSVAGGFLWSPRERCLQRILIPETIRLLTVIWLLIKCNIDKTACHVPCDLSRVASPFLGLSLAIPVCICFSIFDYSCVSFSVFWLSLCVCVSLTAWGLAALGTVLTDRVRRRVCHRAI